MSFSNYFSNYPSCLKRTKLQLSDQVLWRKKQCEVSGTYTAIMSKEDGVTLNVPVDHTLCVEDRQCLQDR